MRIFISGGCKNGKSALAQRLACRQRRPGLPLYYVATMRPGDDEDRARVQRHRSDRSGLGFETVEQPLQIGRLLQRCDPAGSFLLDSLTALLANEQFPPGGFDPAAAGRTAAQLEELLQNLTSAVVVSDFIYSDAGQYDQWSEAYRRGLAQLDRVCVRQCQVVLEVCGGIVVAHKGREAYETLV